MALVLWLWSMLPVLTSDYKRDWGLDHEIQSNDGNLLPPKQSEINVSGIMN